MPSVTCLFLVVAPRGLFHVSLLLLLPFCFVSLPCWWILWSSRWITKALGEFSSFSFERSQLWEEQPRPVTTWLYGFKCSFLNLFALLFFFLLAWIIPVTLAQAVNIAAGTPPFFCLFSKSIPVCLDFIRDVFVQVPGVFPPLTFYAYIINRLVIDDCRGITFRRPHSRRCPHRTDRFPNNSVIVKLIIKIL